MAEITSLREAVAGLVRDGASLAMEGFTHLIPIAAGHEVIRQGRTDLTLIRMTPDVIYDQMIGMGCASKIVFSWGGNPGVGSLHRLRDAIENDYPVPLEYEEHTHAGMATRYAAGASGLPFGILRGYVGNDLADHTNVARIQSPFDAEVVTAVTPTGPNPALLPSWTVDAVAEVPRGSHPSYSMGYTTRDNAFYTRWDAISRDRATFARWMKTYVTGPDDFSVYLKALDDGTLTELAGDD